MSVSENENEEAICYFRTPELKRERERAVYSGMPATKRKQAAEKIVIPLTQIYAGRAPAVMCENSQTREFFYFLPTQNI